MSSFIVSNKTVNSIVTYLTIDRDSSWIKQQFEKLGYSFDHNIDLDKLASDMFHMNCDAVDCRYGKGTSAKDTVEYPAFEYRTVICNEMQVLKNLQCLIYQCSEGDIDERPLYGVLEKMKHSMMSGIISELPEYNSAKWGI